MSTRLLGAKYKLVFDRGRSIKGRLTVAWCLSQQDADRMAGVVVSKKTFHDAVDRNRVKRQLREAYRKHKHALAEQMAGREQGLLIAFIYVSSQIESSAHIEKRMARLLEKIGEAL